MVIYDRSLVVPARDFSTLQGAHQAPSIQRQEEMFFSNCRRGNYFHVLLEAASWWLWEARPGEPQPLDCPHQMCFWVDFMPRAHPQLRATALSSPAAHQMVLSALVNTELICTFFSHRGTPA